MRTPIQALKASHPYQVTRIMSKITYHTDKKHHAGKRKSTGITKVT